MLAICVSFISIMSSDKFRAKGLLVWPRGSKWRLPPSLTRVTMKSGIYAALAVAGVLSAPVARAQTAVIDAFGDQTSPLRRPTIRVPLTSVAFSSRR